MSRWHKHKAADPEIADVVREIMFLAMDITYRTPAEVFVEYHGNFDSLRVYGYTMGEKHFLKTRYYLESRWISKSGGMDMELELMQELLEELKAFGKEVGYTDERE